MKRFLQHALLFVIAIAVIVADQISKAYIRAALAPFGMVAPIPALRDYFTLINTTNTGAAFGMFKAAGGIFTVIAIVVAVAIVLYYRQIPDGHYLIRAALGLQLGGALGNLIDRLRFGTVTDFIFFHWRGAVNAPIFNLADLSITCGVILLALLMWRDSAGEQAAKQTAVLDPAPAPNAHE
ncbi:MAG: signal peptidase II [Chloroflexi bacterium]|nr:signal peptidase II [Chloroflexota bacterium]